MAEPTSKRVLSVEEHIPFARRVFCNRNLRMDSIHWIGFDMDYTLALYTKPMEHLQAEMVMERLRETCADRYPAGLFDAPTYDPDFAIRGLSVDRVHGNVFKMDAHRFVGRVWHGMKPLDAEARRALYTNRSISPSDAGIVMVDTLFSLPEISLYSQLVEALDTHAPEGETPDYDTLWGDLRYAMDSLHRDGTLKVRIRADLARYIVGDTGLGEALHRFRSNGKRLFILTNSEGSYTMDVMSFLLDGVHPSYATWRDYFEVVICDARKPGFFTGDSAFRICDAAGDPVEGPVATLRRGEIYSGGNATELSRILGLSGDEVLYVGDHIYGDIQRSKSQNHWRTAMVVQEMEGELQCMRDRSDAFKMLRDLTEERALLRMEIAAHAVGGTKDAGRVDRVRELGLVLKNLERDLDDAFSPHWGMLYRDRSELSAFGAQVEDFACLYTSRVSNLGLYSPRWYFRSPRDRMAHELRLR